MYCFYCGTEIPNDSLFCEKCGKPVAGNAGSAQPAQPAKPAQPTKPTKPAQPTAPANLTGSRPFTPPLQPPAQPERFAPQYYQQPPTDISAAGGERVVPKGFSAKKNIIIIIIAAVLLIGGGVAAALIVNNSRSASSGIKDKLQLAERYFNEQNYEQAIIEYDKILEIEPMNIDAYLGKAEALVRLGRKDEAIRELRELYEKTKDERVRKKLDALLGTDVSAPSPSEESSSEPTSEPEPEPDPDPEFIWAIEPVNDYDDITPFIKTADYYVESEVYTVKPTGTDEIAYGQRSDTIIYGAFAATKNSKQALIDIDNKRYTDFVYDHIGVWIGTIALWDDTTPTDRFWAYSLDSNFDICKIYTSGIGGPMPSYYYLIPEQKYYDLELIGYDVELPDTFIFFTTEDDKDPWNNKIAYGLYSNGKVVVPAEYDGIHDILLSTYYGSDSGLLSDETRFVFWKNGKLYIFDKNGSCVSSGIYDDMSEGKRENTWQLVYNAGYLPVCREGKWGVLDIYGNEVVSCQFEDITSVYNKKAWAKQNGKWGVIEITGESETTVPETSEAAPAEKTEAELKEIMSSYGNVGAWHYADYDGNGSKEAFAVIVGENDSGMPRPVDEVRFIDNSGNVTVMRTKIISMLYGNANGNYKETHGKGFFWFDTGGGGSGWKTMLFSVKDGNPYELDISGYIQGFYQFDNGDFYTTENEFLPEGGHIYPNYELIYDSATQQFSIGKKLDSRS